MWCAFLLAACSLAVGADGGSAAAGVEPAPLYQLSRETSAAMRREAVAADSAERAAAVQELCELHRRLLTDPRYEQVDTLKDLRGRIYSRLRRVQAELRRELAKSDSAAGKSKAAGAQTLEAARLAAERDLAALAASDSLAGSLSILNAKVGGPQGMVGFGGAAVADNGQALVDLIERTINPAFWDTVGGPGAIVYYQPLQCLVVRASGEVHERIGGVLGDLRAAGR